MDVKGGDGLLSVGRDSVSSRLRGGGWRSTLERGRVAVGVGVWQWQHPG